MKMKNYVPYISIVLVALFFSCKKEETPKPKVIYEDTSKSKGATPIDTTQIEVADLPINMEGTNFLIHPIGVISGNGKGIKSSSNSEQSFTVSNYGEYEITGYLKNLKFQEIGKDSIYVLTERNNERADGHWLKKFQDLSFGFEIFNLFNNQNAITNTWVRDVYTKNQYGIPNYMTTRVFNVKLTARL